MAASLGLHCLLMLTSSCPKQRVIVATLKVLAQMHQAMSLAAVNRPIALDLAQF